MTSPVDVGVTGATGLVGSRLARLLHEHPWFTLREVGASGSSAGRTLAERAPADELGPLPDAVGRLVLKAPDEVWTSPVILSALPSAVARETEVRLAERGHLVVSNASTHRMLPDVPLVIPEVNPDHLDLLEAQTRRWPGGVVTNPNCAVTALAMALAPLERTFGLESVVTSTFQAISGAGRPGPAALDLTDNVVPWIGGDEEDKIANEPRKILGRLTGSEVEPAPFVVEAHANRVPVTHGHLLTVSATLKGSETLDDVVAALREFRGAPEARDLPSAPDLPLEVLDEQARPQPRLDRDRGRGMTVTVGRIRPGRALHVRFVALAHNLDRGAAGAALLNAELCHARGLTARYGP